ncbi:hypothetical protein PSEUBRA_003516 [Kalmanozyma brasiliensis GHG001]|uniref:uncharacterized protein n=1 Tax=Kalmanozyma brasiliensis (strain GHG001) TaxID=1365824 RepID=UPI002867B76A|nr:uncharacterized protein PSEUBRA_003516 [Kalmanozyma brasiliensis GHG001]EST07061.2 hypothetical protein PSEUBRA_003516 [Kalmanozyma brasiliensis GHG001]
MPAITFVTPPGRPSVLRGNTVQEAKAQQSEFTSTDDNEKVTTSALRQSDSDPAADMETRAEAEPLSFQKRILPHLTTSPEATSGAFALAASRKPIDETVSRPLHSDEAKKRSLLSTAMAGSSAQPPRSLSTTNLGILRRAESETARASLDGARKEAYTATEAPVTVSRPRLHFVEPQKDHIAAYTSRQETASAHAEATTSTQPRVQVAEPTPAAAQPSDTEIAPRKRSLVIQEHADVLERAAERAARQTGHLSSEALEQHSHTVTTSTRLRQHSGSSAGDETASTRSSWAMRSNSRGSSIGTSPGVESADNADEPIELELTKPSEQPTMVPIFTKPSFSDRDNDKRQTVPTQSSRKLTFISPAPSKRRRSPAEGAVTPARRESDPDTASSSKSVHAVSDSDGQTAAETSRRVLAFAACPKPERSAKLSPAHATRKSKSKLSASPAPHKLAYSQRLRGIRGTDPIRSPAPNQAGQTAAQMSRWDQIHEDVSSEGSGYSEDEEDGDSDEDDDDDDDSDNDDDDDDDDLSQSNASDIQSLAESLLQHSEDGASLRSDAAPRLPSNAIEGSREAAKPAKHPSAEQHIARMTPSDSQPGPSQQSSRRQSGSSSQGPPFPASKTSPGPTSPTRASQSSRSNQTSPLSRKLKPKDSLSHPMCFLPDAFEESAPPTPTEPDSDAYDPLQRANLLSGWLSEGGSASSSRRASWQMQHPTGASRRGSGEEGLAVPIDTLPPFRRARERAASPGLTSEGENTSRSLGGNAAFIRESAGLGRSPSHNAETVASPRRPSHVDALGISVPVAGRPAQPFSWRQVSSHQVPQRPSTGMTGYRRASHSVEPRKATSAFTSPVGSYSQQVHITGRITPSRGAAVSRPSAGKQRAVSSSSHIRSRPLVAPSTHDDVVVATSPPRHDASAHLKHHLAHSPTSPIRPESQRRDTHASGSTTPGWTSEGQLPSQSTSRYWTQRLSSLAQAMSEELSIVGNAVLGKEKVSTEVVEGEEGQASHRRSRSVPMEGAVVDSAASIVPEVSQQSLSPSVSARRNSAGVPVPKPNAAGAWTAKRDGQTQPPVRRNKHASEEDASSGDEGKPFRFAKKEVGEDGMTRLVVIHTSERA